MIQQKKKRCKDCGRETYLFSHGRCRYCDAKSKLKPPENVRERSGKPLSPVKQYNIPPRTEKRSAEEAEYAKVKARMDRDTKVKVCFFCGKEIKGKFDHHHLLGREGDLLTDDQYLVYGHRSCHDDYHHTPVGKIPWFRDFVERARRIDPQLAERELLKYEK